MANLAAAGVSVPVVDIDDNGTFKYVLLKISKAGNTNKENATYLVRGHKWADYHADLFEECERQIQDNMQVECVGGGRIQHDRDRKNIIVYGYSVGYGQGDHALTCKILKTYYHGYTIEWNNDGY